MIVIMRVCHVVKLWELHQSDTGCRIWGVIPMYEKDGKALYMYLMWRKGTNDNMYEVPVFVCDGTTWMVNHPNHIG